MGTRGETTMAFVNIERKEGGYAVIYLAKEPVNSMDLELWKQIRAAFAECEADSTINGVIFASGLKKDVFTAGLDLKELYAPATSEQRLFEFWRTLADGLIESAIDPSADLLGEAHEVDCRRSEGGLHSA